MKYKEYNIYRTEYNYIYYLVTEIIFSLLLPSSLLPQASSSSKQTNIFIYKYLLIIQLIYHARPSTFMRTYAKSERHSNRQVFVKEAFKLLHLLFGEGNQNIDTAVLVINVWEKQDDILPVVYYRTAVPGATPWILHFIKP